MKLFCSDFLSLMSLTAWYGAQTYLSYRATKMKNNAAIAKPRASVPP